MDPDPALADHSADDRWATRMLDRALWQSSALGLGLWQFLVGIIVAWRAPETRWIVLAAHAALLVIAVLVTVGGRSELTRVAYFSALLCLLTVDLVNATDDLSVAVVCMTFIVSATTFFVMRPWFAAATSCTWVTVAAALTTMVEPESRLALAVAVPATAYSLGALMIIRTLRGFAAATDSEASTARDQHARLVSALAAARASAEHSRTLHDTVINTLGAIASGGRAIADPARLRRRCADDLASLHSLTSGTSVSDPGLDSVSAGLGLSVEWTGLEAEAWRTADAQMSAECRSALRGILKELLLNVEKHAETPNVSVDIRARSGALTVTVSDDGRGFDFQPAKGHGLTESVLRRAEQAGMKVAITTAPRRGTRATIECGVSHSIQAPASTPPTDVEVGAAAILRIATWRWSAGVCTASLASTSIGARTIYTYLSVGMIAVIALTCWLVCRRGRDLPVWLGVCLVGAIPLAWFLGFIGVDFGGSDPALWQAIGLSPLFVILLNIARSKIYLTLSVIALVVSAVVAARVVWADGPDAVGIPIANAALQLGQVVVWLIFVAIVKDITSRLSLVRRGALQDLTQSAALDAATATQRRWRDAQVEAAITVLQEIVDGAEPDDVLRQRAAREEHYLRQVLTLSPDLIHFGPWLARSLGQSRANDIRLSVRVGDHDLEPAAAATVGRALELLLDAVTPKSDVVIAYFGATTDPRITIVGPAGFADLPKVRPELESVLGVDLRATTLRLQDLIEIRPRSMSVQ